MTLAIIILSSSGLIDNIWVNDSQEEDVILGYWEQHLAGWKSLTSVFEGSAGCRSLVHNVPHIKAYQNEVLGIIYDILMSFGVIIEQIKTLKGNKIQFFPFLVLNLKSKKIFWDLAPYIDM